MRNALLLAALLAGCGGSDDPSEYVDCEGAGWPKFGATTELKRCQRACADGPSGEADANGDGFSDSCPACTVDSTARFDGKPVCCNAGKEPGTAPNVDLNAWVIDDMRTCE